MKVRPHYLNHPSIERSLPARVNRRPTWKKDGWRENETCQPCQHSLNTAAVGDKYTCPALDASATSEIKTDIDCPLYRPSFAKSSPKENSFGKLRNSIQNVLSLEFLLHKIYCHKLLIYVRKKNFITYLLFVGYSTCRFY